MTPSPQITALLRHARLVALECESGVPATIETLARLAKNIRMAVVAQVRAGLWKDVGITEWDHIAGLDVGVGFGDVAAGEPPLKISWDFSKTRLPNLVVENDAAGRSS